MVTFNQKLNNWAFGLSIAEVNIYKKKDFKKKKKENKLLPEKKVRLKKKERKHSFNKKK